VDRFLADWVEPALDRLGSEADLIASAPDIRV
jgi:hypothetical protein